MKNLLSILFLLSVSGVTIIVGRSLLLDPDFLVARSVKLDLNEQKFVGNYYVPQKSHLFLQRIDTHLGTSTVCHFFTKPFAQELSRRTNQIGVPFASRKILDKDSFDMCLAQGDSYLIHAKGSPVSRYLYEEEDKRLSEKK